MVLRHLKIVLLSESKYTFFIVPFIYSRKDKLICRDRRQLNIDQLLPVGRYNRKERLQRGISKLLEMMVMFIILIVVPVPKLYTYNTT